MLLATLCVLAAPSAVVADDRADGPQDKPRGQTGTNSADDLRGGSGADVLVGRHGSGAGSCHQSNEVGTALLSAARVYPGNLDVRFAELGEAGDDRRPLDKWTAALRLTSSPQMPAATEAAKIHWWQKPVDYVATESRALKKAN